MNTFLYLIQKEMVGPNNTIYDFNNTNIHYDIWHKIYNDTKNTSNVHFFIYFVISTITFSNDTPFGSIVGECRRNEKSKYVYVIPSAIKYEILNRLINNMFLNDEIRNKILDIFYSTQKIYHAFSRIAYLYKYKKAQIYNTSNLGLTPISIDNKNIIQILQYKKVYLFTSNEINGILNASLSHCPYFFSEPLVCKNPYNNIPFNKSNLYSMYFFLKSTSFNISLLIHQFFLSNFNLHIFLDENEYLIQEYAIKKYSYNTPNTAIYKYIIKMLREYNKNIIIHKEFPKDKLHQIMKPYLYLYLMSNYSINEHKRDETQILLTQKLKRFYNFNTKFGEKIKELSSPELIIINDKHIPFYEKDTNFLISHLNCDD